MLNLVSRRIPSCKKHVQHTGVVSDPIRAVQHLNLLASPNPRMKKFLLTITLVIIFRPFPSLAQPPYTGTSFIDPDIIKADDPTAFVKATYVGRANREVYDRRTEGWTTINAFLFKIVWSDGLTTEAQVNPEFNTMAGASREVRKYGRVAGQLPACLRKDIKALCIHKGTKLFGGGNHSVLIHTGQGVLYEKDRVLEEILFHEASHTSLDENHASAEQWTAAQRSDNAFVSTYAQENPEREDVAESFLCWYAVRQCNRRISQENYNKIMQAIAHRIEYFDKQQFDLNPLCIE